MTGETVFDSHALAEAVRKHRQEKHLVIRAACAEIGITRSTLSRVEREGTSDVNMCVKLCRWLGVPLEKFIIG